MYWRILIARAIYFLFGYTREIAKISADLTRARQSVAPLSLVSFDLRKIGVKKKKNDFIIVRTQKYLTAAVARNIT